MRWGDWYQHDANHVVHRATGLQVSLDVLDCPPALDLWLLEHQAQLTVVDAVHLHIAANELCWCAWSYEGVGDWVDEKGRHKGARREVAHAV